MITHSLGYPRIGIFRELKKANEKYWEGKITKKELFLIAKKLRFSFWKIQSFLDLVPCNDFSFYDQVLDMSFLLGVIPERYLELSSSLKDIDLYFSMARGYQKDGWDIPAMEMTKWFDTNYHYIVPEFISKQRFYINDIKIFNEFEEAKNFLGKPPKPCIIGPVSYLLLGKEKKSLFNRLDLIDAIIPVYIEIFNILKTKGAEWIQVDEPFLGMDINPNIKKVFIRTYKEIALKCTDIKIMLATYFEGLDDNAALALHLPIKALHIDLIKRPDQLDFLLKSWPKNIMLSLGLIDGRNIWKNDYLNSLELIKKAVNALGEDYIMLAPSSSLLHVPFDLELEKDISNEIKDNMAFASQKIKEIEDLKKIFYGNKYLLKHNQAMHIKSSTSYIINDPKVKKRLENPISTQRTKKFKSRQKLQHDNLLFPLFPTTTIGSFPQTQEIRMLRKLFKKGKISFEDYENEIEKYILSAIQKQENIGLDVLVHGEFERNDMVEYFGEHLKGFVVTKNAWLQSYGSRCVKPPIIYGDISRTKDFTVRWIKFAQNKTKKPIKGMLTGPVTIMQWSFVRDDQPRETTAKQIAFAIRDEVQDLEKSGIRIIQIDEPAIREGLPLKQKDRKLYLEWAINAFRISSSGVKDQTQIHTHMCYSQFNDILEYIAMMDADVLTLETSRSQMDILENFFKYPTEIGLGVYDIHSTRVTSIEEMLVLLEKAYLLLPTKNLWVNPDCGLKTRKWSETIIPLQNMVYAARIIRKRFNQHYFCTFSKTLTGSPETL